MIFNVKHEADWKAIKQRKQALTNKNNQRENAKRIKHACHEGKQVPLMRNEANKHERQQNGPFEVTRANTNGTLQTRQGTVLETINQCQMSKTFQRTTNVCAHILNKKMQTWFSSHGGKCSMQEQQQLCQTAQLLE